MPLYNHQQKLLDQNPAKHLLCWDTGSGKSLIGVELGYKNADSVLFIVPKALKEKWVRELNAHPETPRHFVQIVSKEEFRRDWHELNGYKAVVVDEAHYFAGKSQMAKALQKYIDLHAVPFVYLLTATSYMSSPWNIYTLAQYVGHKWNYWDFKQTFFYDVRMGARLVPKVKSGIEPLIAKLVASIGSTVRLDECADVPLQVFETEYFKLTNQQKIAINKITDINPIVRFTKYHQIENGTLKSDGYDPDATFSADKNDRIRELCAENPKVAIFCRYNLQIDSLVRMLKDEGHTVFIIRGDVKDRDSVVRAVERAEKCVVVINAACSEGYELPSVGLCIFASMSFSFKDYKQGIGRFLRINRLKKNVYIHLVTDGVDKAVYDSIMQKKDFDIAIYADK